MTYTQLGPMVVPADQFAAGAVGMLVTPFLYTVLFAVFFITAYVKLVAAGLNLCMMQEYRRQNGKIPEYEKWLDAAIGELKSGTFILLFLFALVIISSHFNPPLFQ